MNDLIHFRKEIDQFMGFHPQSPLSAEQRAEFEGLAYYAENDALMLTVDVDRFADSEPMINMETSTGDQRPYRRWGRFSFAVDGEAATLTIHTLAAPYPRVKIG